MPENIQIPEIIVMSVATARDELMSSLKEADQSGNFLNLWEGMIITGTNIELLGEPDQ